MSCPSEKLRRHSAVLLVLSLRKAVSFGLITAQSCPVWSCHCARLSPMVLSLRKAAPFGLVTAQSYHVWSRSEEHTSELQSQGHIFAQ